MVTVTIRMSAVKDYVVGGQFFLEYDNAKLAFASADPGDPPFTEEIYEFVDTGAGTINYAVGAPAGDPGTPLDTDMAVLTFTALVETCGTAELVTFRAHDPPTRLTNEYGDHIGVLTGNLGAITIDGTPPVITCPGNVTLECDEVTDPSNTGEATATDVCDPSPDITYSDVVTPGLCDDEWVITRTWAAEDDCENVSTCDQVITVQDTVPPDLGGSIATAGPADLSHPGGGEANAAKYFLQPGSSWKGNLVLGTGLDYSVRMEGIDTSGLPGGTLVRVGLQDSVGWGTFGVQAHLDFNGAGGHLLQSFELPPFNVPPDSSHGFNFGDVPGEFDLRFDFYQALAGGTWEITPYYRLEGESDWSLFYDTELNGPWTTTLGYDIVEGLVFVDLGGPNAGTVSFDALNVICTPGCPADITVDADVGGCTAAINPGLATAVDNCDPAPVVTGVRSDFLPLMDPYPAGVTTITWTATDDCGNFSQCFQTITVNGVNTLVVNVELDSRCITFELFEPGCAGSVVVDADIAFTSGLALGAVVEVPCGNYDCITGTDALHTLRRTDDDGDFGISGAVYVADFTSTGTTDDSLLGGNLNDDRWIDILDFGVFTGQWAVNYGLPDTPCGTPFPHADISGNALVGTEDYSFITTQFLFAREVDCCGVPLRMAGWNTVASDADGPVTRISTKELRRRGLEDLIKADLNHDGWLDVRDMEAFAGGARP
ncbi:MAG: cohesin domain-containing protein [Planctomycetota bacterium]